MNINKQSELELRVKLKNLYMNFYNTKVSTNFKEKKPFKMTWDWSHTQEAYDNVYYNISQLSLETLREIATEIKTYQDMLAQRPERVIEGLSDREILWHPELHEMYLEQVNKLPADILVDLIYKFAAEQAECTNGGYEAYVCPYGCHSVSFNRDSINE